jgi:hypothetical protein
LWQLCTAPTHIMALQWLHFLWTTGQTRRRLNCR